MEKMISYIKKIIDNVKSIVSVDEKGMTLLEVVSSMAILSIISVGILNGASLILKGYDMGQFIYESNNKIESSLEGGTAPGTNGSVSFTVGGQQISVDGTYHTSSETRDDMKISSTVFKP